MQSRRWPRLPILAAALLLGSCQAEPPGHPDGSGVPPAQGNRPSLARCTPPSGAAAPACPGTSCADNALGSPDGKTVDLRFCETLDLVFTGGTIIDDGKKQADVAFTFTASSGSTRIDASADGLTYKVLAFIGKLPSGTNPSCAAETASGRSLVYFERCQTMSSASFLRLVRDPLVSGSATLDAVEALSFTLAK